LSVYISRMSVDGRSEVDAPRLQVRSAAAAASVGLVRGVSLRISPHAGSGRGWLGGDHRSSGSRRIAARDNVGPPPDHNKFTAQP
jgi:hypothetical protein